MKVVNAKDIIPVTMNNDAVKHVAGRILIGREDGAKNFCMRLFEMGPGGFTPCHTHDWEHEVFVHSGQGEVFMDGDWHPIKAGSAVFVPPNVEHQFKNPGTEPLVFICLVPSKAPEL
ncbi:MAG: cupin domain-containing protein [Desulfobacterales bacterium]|nr:cupin domain-containing protein [Desulfobacterales bacterium]